MRCSCRLTNRARTASPIVRSSAPCPMSRNPSTASTSTRVRRQPLKRLCRRPHNPRDGSHLSAATGDGDIDRTAATAWPKPRLKYHTRPQRAHVSNSICGWPVVQSWAGRSMPSRDGPLTRRSLHALHDEGHVRRQHPAVAVSQRHRGVADLTIAGAFSHLEIGLRQVRQRPGHTAMTIAQ